MPFTGAAITNKSFDWAYNTKLIDAAWRLMIAKSPLLISQIGYKPAVKANKYHWYDKQLSVLSTVISANTSGALTVSSSAGFAIGDVVRVEETTGATRGNPVAISAIPDTTHITVVAISGSLPAAVDTDVLKFVSRPRAQGETFTPQATVQPTQRVNYMQLFHTTVGASETELNVSEDGVDDIMLEKEEEGMADIMAQLNNSLIWGVPAEAASSVLGKMGGIRWLISNGFTGGLSESASGALTATHLNALLKKIAEAGAFSDNLAILAAPNQAQKISGFNTSGSNPVVQVMQGSREAGQYVSQFIGDLPIMNGFKCKVVVDFNLPMDEIAVVDLNKINFVPQTGGEMISKPTSVANVDGIQRTIRTALTLQVKDPLTAHGRITGLTL